MKICRFVAGGQRAWQSQEMSQDRPSTSEGTPGLRGSFPMHIKGISRYGRWDKWGSYIEDQECRQDEGVPRGCHSSPRAHLAAPYHIPAKHQALCPVATSCGQADRTRVTDIILSFARGAI